MISRAFPHDRDAPIEQSAPGTNVIVAAETGKRIVVHSFFFTLGSAGTLRFRSGSAGRDLTGAMEFDPKGGMVAPSGARGYFCTDPGEGLVIVSTGGAAKGSVNYIVEE